MVDLFVPVFNDLNRPQRFVYAERQSLWNQGGPVNRTGSSTPGTMLDAIGVGFQIKYSKMIQIASSAGQTLWQAQARRLR